MDSLFDLVSRYGTTIYLILFAYCALKSGWLPLFAGYAAHLGALDVKLVFLASFAGGYLGDEIRFKIVRIYGSRWLENDGLLGRLFRRAKVLSQHFGTRYIFIYRYPKGLRTIGALPIGLTNIEWNKFTLLNFSSAMLWATILVGGGYAFGNTLESIGVKNLTALSILLLVVFLITLYQVWHSDGIVEQEQKRDQIPYRGRL